VADVVGGQIEQVLDVWYGSVGSRPHLLVYVSTPAGDPVPEYLSAVCYELAARPAVRDLPVLVQRSGRTGSTCGSSGWVGWPPATGWSCCTAPLVPRRCTRSTGS